MLSKVDEFTSSVYFDAERDCIYSQDYKELSNILHIFDANWHGIRSACGAAPGHKLTISHKSALTDDEIRYILGVIHNYSIKNVVFQAYSKVAANLAYLLWREFGSKIDIRVITHVSTAQFEHLFEIEMLKLMRDQLSMGILSKLGSVKPRFSFVVDFFWNKTILNFVPKVNIREKKLSDETDIEVFVPLENTFRKNLYVNLIGAMRSEIVSRVVCVNEPTMLDDIMNIAKINQVPFLDRDGIFELMSRVDLVMNVTFAECQPMTQLEALAVGTPCLTGPLHVEELQDYELAQLCTVDSCDSPHIVTEAVNAVLAICTSEPKRMSKMIKDYKETINKLAARSYMDFISS